MGAEALVLPDASVVTSDAFKRQSVTSERWLQILQVGMGSLDDDDVMMMIDTILTCHLISKLQRINSPHFYDYKRKFILLIIR